MDIDLKNLKAESLTLYSATHLQWTPEILSQPGAHDVLVQTRTGAVSIGSELPLYCGTSRASKSIEYPRTMDYENVGIVVACGTEVQTVRAGDRVVVFYGHRTHAIVPEAKVIKVPDNISEQITSERFLVLHETNHRRSPP